MLRTFFSLKISQQAEVIELLVPWGQLLAGEPGYCPIQGTLMAWCKFLCVSGEAKLLPVVKQKQLGVFHPTILCFVID